MLIHSTFIIEGISDYFTSQFEQEMTKILGKSNWTSNFYETQSI